MFTSRTVHKQAHCSRAGRSTSNTRPTSDPTAIQLSQQPHDSKPWLASSQGVSSEPRAVSKARRKGPRAESLLARSQSRLACRRELRNDDIHEQQSLSPTNGYFGGRADQWDEMNVPRAHPLSSKMASSSTATTTEGVLSGSGIRDFDMTLSIGQDAAAGFWNRERSWTATRDDATTTGSNRGSDGRGVNLPTPPPSPPQGGSVLQHLRQLRGQMQSK